MILPHLSPNRTPHRVFLAVREIEPASHLDAGIINIGDADVIQPDDDS
jgi:hypothetical protein